MSKTKNAIFKRTLMASAIALTFANSAQAGEICQNDGGNLCEQPDSTLTTNGESIDLGLGNLIIDGAFGDQTVLNGYSANVYNGLTFDTTNIYGGTITTTDHSTTNEVVIGNGDVTADGTIAAENLEADHIDVDQVWADEIHVDLDDGFDNIADNGGMPIENDNGPESIATLEALTPLDAIGSYVNETEVITEDNANSESSFWTGEGGTWISAGEESNFTGTTTTTTVNVEDDGIDNGLNDVLPQDDVVVVESWHTEESADFHLDKDGVIISASAYEEHDGIVEVDSDSELSVTANSITASVDGAEGASSLSLDEYSASLNSSYEASVNGDSYASVNAGYEASVNGGASSIRLNDQGAQFHSYNDYATFDLDHHRITNVADGEDDYDAVNVRQLDNVKKDLKDDIDDNTSGIAAVAAIANIPDPAVGANYSFGVGYGNFQGENAFAVGANARVLESLSLKATAGFSGGDTVFGGGAGWSF